MRNNWCEMTKVTSAVLSHIKMPLLKFVKFLYNLLQCKWDLKSRLDPWKGTARKIRERSGEKEDEKKENWKRRGTREGGGGGRGDCGDADEEEEREKDEEMRGRTADSGISRKVSAIPRRRVLGTDRFLDEPRQGNCESMAQNHHGSSYRSRFEEYQEWKTHWNIGVQISFLRNIKDI